MTEDGIGIGGGVGPAQEGSDGWVTFYVATDDVEGSLKKAESLGGRGRWARCRSPRDPRSGLFNDPEGHLVGVVKMPGA